MSDSSPINKINNAIRVIIKILICELLILTGTGTIWWFGTQHTKREFSDMLFTIACAVFCVGTIIFIAATSRRGYYRDLRNQYLGKSDSEGKYELKAESRKKHIWFGLVLGGAGILGMVLSGAAYYM